MDTCNKPAAANPACSLKISAPCKELRVCSAHVQVHKVALFFQVFGYKLKSHAFLCLAGNPLLFNNIYAEVLSSKRLQLNCSECDAWELQECGT